MFDKYGEFNSVQELNETAKRLKAEGNETELIALAAENGIDKEDAEDYMDGCAQELATPLMAAVGKLTLEAKEYKLDGALKDWVDELIEMCSESSDMAAGVRRKGKGLDDYIALLAEEGYKNRCEVDKRIVAKAPTVKKIIGNHPFSIGIADRKRRREIAREYYLK